MRSGSDVVDVNEEQGGSGGCQVQPEGQDRGEPDPPRHQDEQGAHSGLDDGVAHRDTRPAAGASTAKGQPGKTGMFSRALIWCPHFGHADLGRPTERPCGTRQMTTFRKDPISAPRTPRNTYSTGVSEVSSSEVTWRLSARETGTGTVPADPAWRSPQVPCTADSGTNPWVVRRCAPGSRWCRRVVPHDPVVPGRDGHREHRSRGSVPGEHVRVHQGHAVDDQLPTRGATPDGVTGDPNSPLDEEGALVDPQGNLDWT